MSTITLTKGLPASGKSTWAKREVEESDGLVKRINKDDLRAMIDNSKWSKQNEKLILAARDALISLYLESGLHVIIDDTNLNPEMEKGIRKTFGAEADIIINDSFLMVDVNECVRRDQLRQASVGEKVIRDMWNRWESKWINIDCTKVQTPERMVADLYLPPVGKPDAIIVDIDGTLAHHIDRSPYDYTRVGSDRIDTSVRDIVNTFSRNGHYIIVLSGREDWCREDTALWLKDHNVIYDFLFMRKSKDMRKDWIIKKEIFDEKIRHEFNVRFVLDDRDQVVKMWREVLGIKCLQVEYGPF